VRACTLTLANALTYLRLGSTPFLLAAAWFQFPFVYFCILLLALLTDAIDGRVARRFGNASAEGARLDSLADLAVVASVPVGLWLLFPEILLRHRAVAVSVVAAHLLTYAVGFIKWQRLPSYHTWGTKVTAVLLGTTALLFFWVDRIEWVLYPAATVAFLSYIDEILITLTLTQWESDVPSWWHARRRMVRTDG
jgi:phosphatidylglycerophosphate synthase